VNLDSRAMILLCAILILSTAAGLATMQSEDYIVPLSLLIGGVSMLLFYSLLLTKRQMEVELSTPIETSTNMGASIEYTGGNDALPDPAEVGVETPIL
jgi:arginine exporter protein ArgO